MKIQFSFRTASIVLLLIACFFALVASPLAKWFTQSRIESEWKNDCALVMWSDQYGGNMFVAKTSMEDDFDMRNLSRIREIPDLKVLILRWTKLCDDDFIDLCGYELGSLELLALDDTQITKKGLVSIKQLPQLRILRLQNTSVGDDSVPILCQASLTLLDIRGTNITREGVRELKDCIPEIQVLY